MAKKKTEKVVRIAPNLSKEQSMLNELFGGGDKVMFNNPYSESLPRIDGVLISGYGLINNNDERRTGKMFGF